MRLALALAVLALPLSACGAGVSLNAVAKAADKASKAGSEHVTMSATVTGTGTPVEMHGSGDFTNKPALGSLTTSVKTGGKAFEMDEVLKDTRVYMRSPIYSTVLPSGKQWVVIDFQKSAKKLGVNFNQLTSQSPSDTLAALEKVGSVKKIGPETVDGVQTIHYTATIDISKSKALKKLEEAVTYHYEPVQVWIGKDSGLPVRLTMAFVVENAGNSIRTAMKMDYSSYGEQVNVAVPPASETYDMTSLGG